MIFNFDATETSEYEEMEHVPLTKWCCDLMRDLLGCGYWLHMPMDDHHNGGVIHGGTGHNGNEIWIQFCPGCGEKIQYAKLQQPDTGGKVERKAVCHACAEYFTVWLELDDCEQDLECPHCHATSGEALPCHE